MTVHRDDHHEDDLLANLANLGSADVSPRRSHQLRKRCHAILEGEPPQGRRLFPLIVPALGCAWCVAYLLEIIRCTAALYAYFGRP